MGNEKGMEELGHKESDGPLGILEVHIRSILKTLGILG
jgi:hypothetical protein